MPNPTSCPAALPGALRTTFAVKSCDFRAGAAKMYFIYYTITCTEKQRLSSRSCQSVHRILLKICDFPAGTLCATLVLKSCHFPAAAAKMYFVCYTCTAMRLSSRSCQSVLCIVHLYGKVATFKLELPNYCKPMLRKNPILTDTSA